MKLERNEEDRVCMNLDNFVIQLLLSIWAGDFISFASPLGTILKPCFLVGLFC
jgi:hypothetical protein